MKKEKLSSLKPVFWNWLSALGRYYKLVIALDWQGVIVWPLCEAAGPTTVLLPGFGKGAGEEEAQAYSSKTAETAVSAVSVRVSCGPTTSEPSTSQCLKRD